MSPKHDFSGWRLLRDTTILFPHITAPQPPSAPLKQVRAKTFSFLPQVYYDIKIDADGRVQATNVTGPGGAYVEGQRGGGIILDEDLDKPPATPKRKGSIRDFTESQFWGTERVQPEDIGEAVPPAPEPDEKWWED